VLQAWYLWFGGVQRVFSSFFFYRFVFGSVIGFVQGCGSERLGQGDCGCWLVVGFFFVFCLFVFFFLVSFLGPELSLDSGGVAVCGGGKGVLGGLGIWVLRGVRWGYRVFCFCLGFYDWLSGGWVCFFGVN